MLVVKRPHFSPKSSRYNRVGKYVFIVDQKANKIQIKNAITALYGVQVEQVQVMNYPVKKITRYTQKKIIKGAKKAYKKGIVTLRKGDKIDVHHNDQ